jgi:hypothetical protein
MIIFREELGYWRWRWTVNVSESAADIERSREAFSNLRDCIRDSERWQRHAPRRSAPKPVATTH